MAGVPNFCFIRIRVRVRVKVRRRHYKFKSTLASKALREMGLGELGLGEMGQNQISMQVHTGSCTQLRSVRCKKLVREKILEQESMTHVQVSCANPDRLSGI